MTVESHNSTTQPVLSSIAAQLYVSDVRKSVAFFVGKLGFTQDFVYGNPPFFGQVKRDRALIALRLVCEPVFVGDVREREHLLSASITVGSAAEISQLFLDCQSAGVTFHQPLKMEPWGARTFIVSDLDGNLILFAGPAS
jgi:catechol 2,3-dioxygenase-like lactoylglutathione lyase family enzyme